jgi:DNA replication protein DnaC
VEYLRRLAEAEAAARYERSVQRRTKAARLPVLKTLEQFDWSWPKKINRAQVQDLFRLRFIEQNSNVVFIGNVGLGKTHFALALAHSACLNNISTLFAQAVEIVNTLSAAQAANTLSKALKAYAAPRLLVIDELGYLPMDKRGADLIFQVVSARYERGATLITTNTAYKHWAPIFNNDATLTTAILDRLVHHCETVTIEGKSFRSQKDE